MQDFGVDRGFLHGTRFAVTSSSRTFARAFVLIALLLTPHSAAAQCTELAKKYMLDDPKGNANDGFISSVKEKLVGLDADQKKACLKTLQQVRWEVHDKIREFKGLEYKDKDKDKDKILNRDEQIRKYSNMENDVLRVLEDEDPYALAIDFYAAVVFSSLYRDPATDQGIFSKSRPFLQLEAGGWVGPLPLKRGGGSSDARWGLFNRIALETAAFASNSGDSQGLQAVNSFSYEGDVEVQWPQGERWGVGLVAGAGAEEFGKSFKGDADFAPRDANSFGMLARVGIRTQQLSGAWRGTVAEVSWFRDPFFVHHDRLMVRARVAIAPQAGDGRGLGTFLEGSLNAGSGRDDARIVVGIRLDTLAVLRAIVGSVGTSSP